MGIVVENLTKSRHGVPRVRNVSLRIKDRDFAVLLAPTGSGKTTLLKLLAGIEKPDSGRILFDGRDVTGLSAQKRNIAMVYQQFVNYPSLTVYENIASPLRVSKTKYSEDEIKRKVHQTAELLGIRHILNHLPEEVSGGQKQRTAIARALAKGTKYIFLDEPLANLDYKLREELRGELKLIFREGEGAIVYATPEPLDALGMASHVGFMHRGEIMQYGPVKDVYRHPNHVEVGQYFSYPTMNIFDAKKETHDGKKFLVVTEQLRVEVTHIADSLDHDRYYLGIHAHAVALENSDRNLIEVDGTVQLTEAVGSDSEVHVDHAGQSVIVLMQDIVSYPIGHKVKLYFKADQFFVFHYDSEKLCAKTEKSVGQN